MRNRKKWMVAGVVSFMLLVLTACSEESEPANTENFEEADKVAYEYILAKIERDDDRMKELLTTEGIEYATNASLLKEGEHLYPGKAEELEDKYEIVRYQFDDENVLYYKVKYDAQNNSLSTSVTEYIELVNDEKNGWKLTKPVGISNDLKADLFPTEEIQEAGTVVHQYEN